MLIFQSPAIRRSIHSIMLLAIPFPTPSSSYTLATYRRMTLWVEQRFSMIIQYDKKIISVYQHGRNPSLYPSNMLGTA